ncbi:MAG: hypothetical protein SFU57_13660 [Gemmatimonadales bacterium]|nr:hypothetical protein [Gemmatimonadales bacterium]
MFARIIALNCMAFLAACRANLAQEPTEAFRERIEAAASIGDTAALATLVGQRCDALDGEALSICREDTFLLIASERRVSLALGALATLGQRDRGVAASGHALTHVIGITAWQPGDDVATVFRSCNGLFQSGCYHGVIQAYLTAEGEVDSIRTTALCDEIDPTGIDRWLRFQCVHGLGHGLEMAWNWDLPRALGGCDWLATDWDRQACYGGAFMENSVASTPGAHHTATRALDAGVAPPDDGHAAHQHGPPSAPPFKMRDSADALYPCSVVGDRYLAACYLSHGGILLAASGNDFGRAAAACADAPEQFRWACHLSLGTNASGWTLQDTPQVISHCSQGDPAYRPWCFVGAVKNYIDVTADPADGIAFCSAVPSGASRQACWRAVGEQLAALYSGDGARRAAECDKIESAEGRGICRGAARVGMGS